MFAFSDKFKIKQKRDSTFTFIGVENAVLEIDGHYSHSQYRI